jgi:hypothetical protein
MYNLTRVPLKYPVKFIASQNRQGFFEGSFFKEADKKHPLLLML